MRERDILSTTLYTFEGKQIMLQLQDVVLVEQLHSGIHVRFRVSRPSDKVQEQLHIGIHLQCCTEQVQITRKQKKGYLPQQNPCNDDQSTRC